MKPGPSPSGPLGTKRERDEDEPIEGQELLAPNERFAKVIVYEPRMAATLQEYNAMARAEQQAWIEQGSLDNFPEHIQELIAVSTVGTLLTMAPVSPFFRDLARNDHVWKRCFARDFPDDYNYFRGELPFFVITPDHPLYPGPTFIDERDESPWRRLYLHTNLLYRDAVDNFVLRYSRAFEQFGVVRLPEKTTAAQLYRWAHRHIFGAPWIDVPVGTLQGENIYDWRSRFAWCFVRLIVWLNYLDDPNNLQPVRLQRIDMIRIFGNVARTRPWMWPYLVLGSVSQSFGVVGLMPNLALVDAALHDNAEWQSFYATFDRRTYVPFSQADRERYRTYLRELPDEQHPQAFIFRTGDDNDTLRKGIATREVFDLWARACQHPCAWSCYRPNDLTMCQLSNLLKEGTRQLIQVHGWNIANYLWRFEPPLSDAERARLDEYRIILDFRSVFNTWATYMFQAVGFGEMYPQRFVHIATYFLPFMGAPRHQHTDRIIHLGRIMANDQMPAYSARQPTLHQ